MLRARPRALVIELAAALVGAACAGDAGAGGDEVNVVIGPADEGIDGVMAIRVPNNTHTEGVVDYQLPPPAGGLHNPVWLNCGFYDEPSPDENLVHDLEHGAVWLAYSPELDAADVDVLHDIARDNDHVLASPYEDLDAGVAVVATAWARQLTLDAVDDPRLDSFVEQYQNGPQAPESGASCSGTDLGTPIP